ncbi:hypothetical protein LSAT2_009783 [Lamellibrachia satsuma]|nr:hypothetical protein LSAT2_009783 [Lamellibrachia satsuma]
MLISDTNFLRCPECRLVYQLRQGIKSLPRNVALQRAIDEHCRNSSFANLRCEQHPDDAASLYCKTCEKSICLKCFFSAKGQSVHNDHDVDTSEDAFSQEMRLLDELKTSSEETRDKERVYISELEQTEHSLMALQADKLAMIEKHKNDMLSVVKATAAKLKFTLNGSVARDREYLQMALSSSKERLVDIETVLADVESVFKRTGNEPIDINVLKQAKQKLDSLNQYSVTERPEQESFMKVAFFDTDLESCLHDPQRALSYQTEPPKEPRISDKQCIISDSSAYIELSYNETVRAKQMTLHYQESLYKGLSEKDWQQVEVVELSHGKGHCILRDLRPGTMYRMYAVGTNDFGDSPRSKELWFRTVDGEIEKRIS